MVSTIQGRKCKWTDARAATKREENTDFPKKCRSLPVAQYQTVTFACCKDWAGIVLVSGNGEPHSLDTELSKPWLAQASFPPASKGGQESPAR